MIVPLVLAVLAAASLAPQAAGRQAHEARVREGGRRAVELVRVDPPLAVRNLAAGLARVPAAADVLLALHDEGALPAEWGGQGIRLDEEQRSAVVEAWSRIPGLQARAALERVAADPHRAHERSAAIDLLGRIADAADLDLLFRLVPTFDPRPPARVQRRQDLLVALERILARDRWALEGLREAFVSSNALWLGTIVQAAEECPWDERLEFLASLLPRVHAMTIPLLSAIGRLGRTTPHPTPESVRARVRPFLERADPALVLASARAVGSLEDHDSVERLVDLLDHEEGNVRRAAEASLIEITGLVLADAQRWHRWFQGQATWWDVESDDVFRILRTGKPSIGVQLLATLGGRRYRRHELAGEVATVLERRDEGLLIVTCAVLGQLGSEVAVPALQRTLGHRSPEVQRAAQGALDRIRERNLAYHVREGRVRDGGARDGAPDPAVGS